MHNIVVTIGSSFSDDAQKQLEQLGTVACIEPSSEALLPHLETVTILVVQLGLEIDAATIDAATNLECIATATTGLDHIDTAYAEQKGITVVSLKGETEFLTSITSTAELALGLLLGLARNMQSAANAVLEGRWDTPLYKGHSLSGMTLGVLGVGRLGRMMVSYGKALGMDVLGCDIAPDVSVDCTYVSLEELLEKSDVLSIHLPLEEDTKGMVGEAALKLLKPSAYIVNTARGKIVDEQALLAALQEQRIAGYATDVLDGEVAFDAGDCSDHPLVAYAREHQTVIITPHIGGMTHESRTATDCFIAEKIVTAMRE